MRPHFRRFTLLAALLAVLGSVCDGSAVALRTGSARIDFDKLQDLENATVESRAAVLKQATGFAVEVQGHTDNVGADADNQRLSEQRATAVAKYLTGYGIEATRVTSAGFGETKPVASNDTEEGRAQNRRTEITVL